MKSRPRRPRPTPRPKPPASRPSSKFDAAKSSRPAAPKAGRGRVQMPPERPAPPTSATGAARGARPDLQAQGEVLHVAPLGTLAAATIKVAQAALEAVFVKKLRADRAIAAS